LNARLTSSPARAQDLEGLNAANAAAALAAAPVALFLQATYGDGEPTDSSAAFCRWAGEQSPPALQPLSFAVFGLGNTQYEHYNAAAKRLDAHLAAASATRLLPLGLGDDDGSLEEDWAAWRARLWPALEAAAPRLAGSAADRAVRRASEDALAHAAPPPPAYIVSMLPSGPSSPPPTPAAGGAGREAARGAAALSARRELHSAGGRSCLHVELSLPGGWRYETGDHVALYPRNSEALVAQAAALLGAPLDALFALSLPAGDATLPPPFPTPCTLRCALECYADLQSPPRRPALAALAACCSGPEGAASAARLAFLASPAGKTEFGSYITAGQRSLLEVMADFPSARPGIGLFFGAVAPRLAPRYYSISSSPRAAGGAAALSVTVAVVDGDSPTGRRHRGVASTWLSQLPLRASVPFTLRASAFRLPVDHTVPIVMVGPGTGLAPFRGFLQERGAAAAGGARLGEAHLFFGCRSSDCDYIYREELEAAVGPVGVAPLTRLHVAFSRPPGGGKTYVQALLAANGAEVYALLAGGGVLYVCGDAKNMARDVHRALLELLQRYGRLSAAEAEAETERMHEQGRLQRDVW